MAAATNLVRFEDRMPIDVFIVSPNGTLRGELKDKLSPPRWRVVETNGGAEALGRLREHGDGDAVLLLDPQPARSQSGRIQSHRPRAVPEHAGPDAELPYRPASDRNRVADSGIEKTGRRRQSQPDRFARQPRPAVPEENPTVQIEGGIRLRSMVGDSEPMLRTYALTRMVAARDTTVLVTGESGTGKDLIAQEIHLISARRNQPFVVVNCSAIPETLLEAELFGYTKGSFTGAVQSRIGRIHAAHGGTLFLDEIGDMPLSLQSKILRFLEQGEVQRLGGNDNLKVDVRVIAATNADLKARVAQQQFREDLFYRLAVFPIHLPPLRERLSDVEELAADLYRQSFMPGVSLSPRSA